jgi:MHS family proline/betaine transporter-like MFS transporter
VQSVGSREHVFACIFKTQCTTMTPLNTDEQALFNGDKMASQQRAPKQKSTTRLIAAGIAGNLLEWFDFAVYGYFAVAIGQIFFPKEDPVAQVLAAFAVFAVGFLMRPVGGIVLGHIGDKYGRHRAMLISVAAMAIPTFLVGVLPGYATLGIVAPIVLVLLRMIQGLSIGGEYTTSIIYMIEHTEPKRRGFVGSFAVGGAVGGMLLGSGFGALLATLLTEQQLHEWGWRIPFLVGLFLGLAGVYLRREPLAQGALKEKPGNPLMTTLKHHRGVLAQVAGIAVINAVVFYLSFVYLVSWLETVDGLPAETALQINTVSLLVLLPVMLLGGWWSDRIGGKRVLIGSAMTTIVLAWPCFWLLHQPELLFAYAGQLGLALPIGLYLGAQPAFLVKVIAPQVRCTAAGLGYNITLGVAGGLSPMMATWLVSRTHDDLSPAYMIIAAGLISVVALLTVRDNDLSQKPAAPDFVARAQALIAAVDRGGVPSNPLIVNSIARGLGLEVSRQAAMPETIDRIRAVLVYEKDV